MCFSSHVTDFMLILFPVALFLEVPLFLDILLKSVSIFLILIRLLDPSPPEAQIQSHFRSLRLILPLPSLPEPVLLQYLLIYKEQNIPPPLQMAYNILIKRTD